MARHARAAGVRHGRPSATSADALEGQRQIVRVARAVHFARLARHDQIGTAADIIADDGRKAGRHRFIHDESPRFIELAWQHETVGRGVHLAEPALIHES